MALKQQTCAAPLYPPRCAVGNAMDWTETGYAPTEYEMPLLDKVPHELPCWADKKTCSSVEVGKRLTYCDDAAVPIVPIGRSSPWRQSP